MGLIDRRPDGRSTLELKGKRILVPSRQGEPDRLAKRIRAAGGDAVEYPAIAIVEPGSEEQRRLNQLVARLVDEPSAPWDWLIFTSRRAVDHVIRRLEEQGGGPADLKKCRILCGGPKTAKRLAKHGYKVDLVPESGYGNRGVLKLIQQHGAPGDRLLMPRSQRAAAWLPQRLDALGFRPQPVIAYRTVLIEGPHGELLEQLLSGALDAAVFTSPSKVQSVFEDLQRGTGERDTGADPLKPAALFDRLVVVCMGPSTAETLKHYGVDPGPLPGESTLNGLFSCLVEQLSRV